MPMYAVEVIMTTGKTFFVRADNEHAAIEAANNHANPKEDDDLPETYSQLTGNVSQMSEGMVGPYPIIDVSTEDTSNERVSHWDEHPDFPVADWRYEVMNDDTRLGYHDWVQSQQANAQDASNP